MIRSAEIQKLRQKEESTQTQLKFQQPQRLANAKTQSKEKSLPLILPLIHLPRRLTARSI